MQKAVHLCSPGHSNRCQKGSSLSWVTTIVLHQQLSFVRVGSVIHMLPDLEKECGYAVRTMKMYGELTPPHLMWQDQPDSRTFQGIKFKCVCFYVFFRLLVCGSYSYMYSTFITNRILCTFIIALRFSQLFFDLNAIFCIIF